MGYLALVVIERLQYKYCDCQKSLIIQRFILSQLFMGFVLLFYFFPWKYLYMNHVSVTMEDIFFFKKKKVLVRISTLELQCASLHQNRYLAICPCLCLKHGDMLGPLVDLLMHFKEHKGLQLALDKTGHISMLGPLVDLQMHFKEHRGLQLARDKTGHISISITMMDRWFICSLPFVFFG